VFAGKKTGTKFKSNCHTTSPKKFVFFVCWFFSSRDISTDDTKLIDQWGRDLRHLCPVTHKVITHTYEFQRNNKAIPLPNILVIFKEKQKKENNCWIFGEWQMKIVLHWSSSPSYTRLD
jgi:hypothetical protein